MKVKRRMSKLAEMIGSNDRKIRMHLLHREKGGEPGTAREGPETRALREAGHPHDTIKRTERFVFQQTGAGLQGN